MFDLTAIDAKLTTTMWNLRNMAADATASGANSIIKAAKEKEAGLGAGDVGGELYTTTTGLAKSGYGIVFGVVTVLVLILIVVKGFEFAMASAADRDEKKKSLIRVVVGGIVIFAATGIATALARFGGSLFPTTAS